MTLKHFKSAEFRNYWHLMNRGFLVMCDNIREQSGFKMIVSPNPESLGRTSGGGWHNYIVHKEVFAADFFVSFDGKPLNQTQALYFRQCALDCGIKGIGLYPHWVGPVGTGFHLDGRTVLTNKVGRDYDAWGRITKNGKIVDVSFKQALEYLPKY